MRKNFPINNNEVRVQADQYLISKTDLKGRIVYANPAFIEISGFTREELIGKAHNVVRHPEMPPVAFADLWQTLEAGKPWLGLVKNRRKDGGYYWVQALVSPIIENKRVTGYSSIRVRPTDEQIRFASECYEKINNNALRGYTIKEGQIVATGIRRVMQWVALPFRRTAPSSLLRLVLFVTFFTALLTYVSLNSIELSAPWLLSFVIAALGVTCVWGWSLSKRMVRPLINAANAAQQIAAGNLLLDEEDLDQRQPRNENENLFFVFSIMRKGLSAIADDTHAGIQASMRVADAINQSNELLEERTQQQASSLQQTAVSMEELTITVQQNADNARQATELAASSMQTAQQGGVAVQNLVQSMLEIQQESKRIADIVNLIDGIAFQTNILALNAAVESARAGEAGRGFAVVAGEVRSLAQRSAQAASDIKALIENSVQRVDGVANQAQQAGETMQGVVGAVDRVSHIISEIAAASSEQATGLHQIHQAITQIDDVTQQNASLVHDLGVTVQQLSGHADTLDQAIRVLSTNKTPSENTTLQLL